MIMKIRGMKGIDGAGTSNEPSFRSIVLPCCTEKTVHGKRLASLGRIEALSRDLDQAVLSRNQQSLTK